MNRRERRARGIPTGGTIDTPPLVLKVLRINPWAKAIEREIMPMSPEGIRAFMGGKLSLQQAVIGHAHGADILFIGDKRPQVALLGDVEPTYVVRDDAGAIGPICHGIGCVVGLLPVHKKAINVPVDIDWLFERVVWDVAEEITDITIVGEDQ